MSMLLCDAGKLLPGAPRYTKHRVNLSTSAPPAQTGIEAPAIARKAFVVNEAVREKVPHLAGVGVRQDDIAKIVGCAPKTLRKRCRDDLDCGVAEANATVSGYLFAAAKAGNVTAQIFWLKSRAHWHEKTVAEDPVARGNGEPDSPAVPTHTWSHVLYRRPNAASVRHVSSGRMPRKWEDCHAGVHHARPVYTRVHQGRIGPA